MRNKKALLTMAVFGLISVSMEQSTPVYVSASPTYLCDSVQKVGDKVFCVKYYARSATGNIPGVQHDEYTLISDGSSSGGTATNDPNKANTSLNNIDGTGKQVVRDTVAGDISTAKSSAINTASADATNKANKALSDAKADSTSKANTAEKNAKSYTDLLTDSTKTYAKTYTDEIAEKKANIGLDNINDAGKQVIRDLAKSTMKDSGINADGNTIIINKPMNTKDIHVDGSITTTGGIEAGGDIHGKGNLTIDGDTHLKGNAEIDKDLTVHGNQTVDGDSTIHGNQTIDKDLIVHGNQTVDGDSTIHGNQIIDKDLHVKGDTMLDGKLDVGGNTHLKGSAEIDKDLTVHGNQTIDGDSTIHGNQTIDKDLTVGGDTDMKGNTRVEKDLTVNGNAEVDKDLHVKGDARVDGDVYGRSFNVGDERYIDKDGINANNHKIRNVADGRISADSLDAVNGRQLYDVKTKLTQNITEVGAMASAMSGLHPLEYDKNDKVSVAAAVGGYKNEQALAAGVFYRPNQKSMISFSGSLGNNDNMYNIGYSQKLGKVTEQFSPNELQNKVSELSESNEALQQTAKKLSEKNSLLETSLSEVKNAYNSLLAKVDGLMSKIGDSNANTNEK